MPDVLTTVYGKALADWKAAAEASLHTRLAYERAYATALTTVDGKSAEIRKAQADLLSLRELEQYQLRAIEARACEHFLSYLEGVRVDPRVHGAEVAS